MTFSLTATTKGPMLIRGLRSGRCINCEPAQVVEKYLDLHRPFVVVVLEKGDSHEEKSPGSSLDDRCPDWGVVASSLPGVRHHHNLPANGGRRVQYGLLRPVLQRNKLRVQEQ